MSFKAHSSHTTLLNVLSERQFYKRLFHFFLITLLPVGGGLGQHQMNVAYGMSGKSKLNCSLFFYKITFQTRLVGRPGLLRRRC